ncbi:hypothetical protein LCGC14_2980070, partial [marine sediment metagenome]
FMSDDLKNQMRLLWERGQLSNQTYAEIVGEVDYKTEVARREKEARDGLPMTMYPPITQNIEDKGIDLIGEEVKNREEEDVNGKPIPTDKLDDPKKFDIGKKTLKTAPYKNITDLPPAVKNNISSSLQKTFLTVFNKAHVKYGETRAFRIAWSVIRKIAKKNKSGKWIRISSKIKLTYAMVEKVLEEDETKVINDSIKEKDIELKNKQILLVDKFLKQKKDKK